MKRIHASDMVFSTPPPKVGHPKQNCLQAWKTAGCFLVVMAWGFWWLGCTWLVETQLLKVFGSLGKWPKIYPDPETRSSSEGEREGVKTPEKSLVGSDNSFPFLGQKTYFQSELLVSGSVNMLSSKSIHTRRNVSGKNTDKTAGSEK